jgi:hypothetical protein
LPRPKIAEIHNEKSSENIPRHLVGADLLKDELRDQVTDLKSKINALEMKLAALKAKSWYQRLWGRLI